MNYTNTSNLPAPLVSAIKFSDYDAVGDISVTGLIRPPRISQLTKRHDAEITEDASEGIWRLIGSIGHKILERADTDNHLPEERLTTGAHNWIISGKPDLLDPDYTLSDYKFTSVWAMKDAKAEWEQQINLYALIYRHHHFIAQRARIVAVLRDWSKMKAFKDGDYPQVGVVVREVPLWPPEQQEAFLGERVRVHQQAEKLADDDLPICTEAERWHKPDVWAVKKKGGKRAVPGGLQPTQDDAVIFAQTRPGAMEVEYRPGEDTRCLHYCAVKDFCSHGKTLGQPIIEEGSAA